MSATEIPDEAQRIIRDVVAELRETYQMSDEECERWIAFEARLWLAKLNSKTPLNAGTFPDPRQSSRRWVCFSTALTEGWLMLHCDRTGAQGVVKDPTREEWSWAFDCPSNPKPWWDNKRVTVMKEGNQ